MNGAEGNYFQEFGAGRRGTNCSADAISEPLKWFGTHTLSGGANLSSVDMTQAGTRGEIQALRSEQDAGPGDDVRGDRTFTWRTRWPGDSCRIRGRPNKHVVVQAGVRAD